MSRVFEGGGEVFPVFDQEIKTKVCGRNIDFGNHFSIEIGLEEILETGIPSHIE